MKLFNQSIPFENLDVMSNTTREITRENVIDKILIQKTGGMCYHLNSLMYYFLQEQGFNCYQISSSIDIIDKGVRVELDNVHISTVLLYQGRKYLVDVGTLVYLSQAPVLIPECGITNNATRTFYAVIESDFGLSRIRETYESHKGSHVFEYIKNSKNTKEEQVWKSFLYFSLYSVVDKCQLNQAQEIIKNDKQYAYTKAPVISKTFKYGIYTLTPYTFTTNYFSNDCKKSKIPIVDMLDYHKKLLKYFGINPNNL
ncbi:hypothetical protein DLAC_04876 [Tieghemostelium lacteum]|uniref:Uncharacterized protein n=1 Tax=Tieghemostelium lacteum TaxID=361077 RepID=A0A151ZJ31_TIELA|nr:hypothetical protein DLAC_04876 [Tieghemostelium lacteum]|eukprot:KYQ93983.1 hypothetical protein DLAC_04876 [Tieghemostelium lacteum]